MLSILNGVRARKKERFCLQAPHTVPISVTSLHDMFIVAILAELRVRIFHIPLCIVSVDV